MKTTLDRLKPGETGTIDQFTNLELSLKLLEMGCTPGEEVQVVRRAPLGDPIAILVSGYLLSMRRQEAATVVVIKSSVNGA
jgi:ferrous iron transport protein A